MFASHGAWCGAVTWRTKCQGCGEPVFFFHCNCGCKVFFDELGAPWPIHDCETSWTRNLIRTRKSDGTITVQLSEGIVATRAPEEFAVDEATISLGKSRNSSQTADPIIGVPPDGTGRPFTIVGLLRETAREVDVARVLRLCVHTTMVSAFLGPLGVGRWGRVTVHVPSPSRETMESYTAFIPSAALESPRSKKGVTVSLELQSLDIPTLAHEWYSIRYEVLG